MSNEQKSRPHQRMLRDSIQGITRPAIRRLARRGGVKRISGLVYEESRDIVKFYLEKIIRNSINIMRHSGRKTLTENHVREALSFEGIHPLFYHKKPGKKPETEKPAPVAGKDGKKRRTHKKINNERYVYKVLKQVHPNTGITGNAHVQVSQFSLIMTHKLSTVARELSMNDGRKTLNMKDIETAVRLVLPGELAKNAVTEGRKAVDKFNQSTMLGATRSVKAGLTFSISRTEAIMRGRKTLGGVKTTKDRLGGTAAVYLTTVVEYLVAEILELAGIAARDSGLVRIKSRHVMMAIKTDEEINKLADKVGLIVVGGGVVPHIHGSLLKK